MQDVSQAFSQIIALMMSMNLSAEQDLSIQKDVILEKALQSLKVSTEEWNRDYMKGGGKAPPSGYEQCPFCGCLNIDSPPGNVEQTCNG